MRFGGRFQGRFSGRFGGRFDGGAAERPSTNLLLQSQTLDVAPWTNAGATVTPNAILAPDGSLTAEALTVAATAGLGRYQVITVVPATQYTFSFFAQLGTLPLAAATFSLRNDTAGAFIGVDLPIDPATGVGGWTRTEYVVTTPAGCVALRVYPLRTHSTLFAAGDAYYWGCQLELGAGATSYIATTTVPVSRP